MGRKRNGRGKTVWDVLQEVWEVLPPRCRRCFWSMGAWQLLIAAVEVVSVASLFPLIYAALYPAKVASMPVVGRLHAWLKPQDGGVFILQLLGLAVIIFLVKELVVLWARHRHYQRIFQIGNHLARRLLSDYYRLPYERIVRENPYRFTTMIMNLAYTYAQGILVPLLHLVTESIILVVLAVVAMAANPLLFSVLLMVVVPALWVGMIFLRRWAHALSRRTQRLQPVAYQRLHDATRHLPEIKSFQAVPFFQQRFLRKHQELTHVFADASTLATLPRHFMEVVMLLGVGILIAKALFEHDVMPALTFMGLFLAASYRLAPSINRIMNSLTLIQKNQHILREMEIFRGAETDVELENRAHSTIPPLREGVTFRNVSFTYAEAGAPVLSSVDMEWPKGAITVLIGPSGAGKTTLFRLAGGFLFPQRGAVMVDGMPLGPENVEAWHPRLGFMPAQPLFFAGSVLENLTLSAEAPDLQQVHHALEAVDLWELVNELPGRLHYEIGEGGARLSDGQRQRLALARLLYFDPDVWLLDEPTAFLDRRLEEKVLDLFDRLRTRGKTVVMITHQASVVSLADHVYRVQNGRVDYMGSGREVLAGPVNGLSEILNWG